MANDIVSRSSLKNYARTVLSEDSPTNIALLKMFDEIIDNAPPAEDPICDECTRVQCDPCERFNNNGWIPVSERLPEDKQEVQITYKINGKYHVWSAIWDELHCRFYDKEYRSYISVDYVIAWMPQSESYKEV